MDTQAIFDALADPTRRRVLGLLQRRGELCVCELTAALDQGQPKISRHLAILKDAGLAIPRRQGTWMHYRLGEALPAWAGTLIAALDQGAVPELDADLARLEGAERRPARCAA